MAIATKVLSPEEIRAKLEGRVFVPTVTEEQVEETVNKVESIKRNKRMTPAEIREGMDLLFQKYDFSPVEELILIARSDETLESTKVSICKFLTEFLIPKLKSVEVKGQVDHNHMVVIRRFGPDGKPEDKPLVKVPGLPAPGSPVKEAARATERVIDAEVVK